MSTKNGVDNMEIKRDLYLNKLIKRECNGLVKVITGIRRCGKSYLLFNLYHDYLIQKGVKSDLLIEIALDDIMNYELREPDVNCTKYLLAFPVEEMEMKKFSENDTVSIIVNTTD